MPNVKSPQPYPYDTFSRLAGKTARVRAGKNYRVIFRPLAQAKERKRAFWLVLANLVIEAGFTIWLLLPGHFPQAPYNEFRQVGNAVLYTCVVLIELIRLYSIAGICLGTLLAREPLPVRARERFKVALTTTIVPSKEPIESIRTTLEAMTRVQHAGTLDLWLLDEGDDPAVKAVCRELGIRHFSRRGYAKWNQPNGAFKAKTKHGNYNAWLDAKGKDYDLVACIDPDHRPLPNYLHRMIGYFQDPDVAFVVGPQVYGNYDSFISKAAESQAYVFQSIIQRAGNAYGSGMFVGTNNAFRVRTWQQIGGFQDSITEDLRTSLAVHSSVNPATGQRWRSVYTPDVVAVGEGPSSWTDFFSQQLRWSQGASEILRKYFPHYLRRLSWKQRLHYSVLLLYYPSVAVGWMLAALIGVLYLIMGFDGPIVPLKVWGALYLDAAVVQLGIYAWLRRYNVSPHEKPGSFGALGIFISVLSAPVYAAALVGAITGRKTRFVVTPKGDSTSPDNLGTFSKHIFWAIVFELPIAFGLALGHYYSLVLFWSTLSFGLCVTPLVIWLVTKRRTKAPAVANEPVIIGTIE